jgi:hypothetical protein
MAGEDELKNGPLLNAETWASIAGDDDMDGRPGRLRHVGVGPRNAADATGRGLGFVESSERNPGFAFDINRKPVSTFGGATMARVSKYI